MKVYNQVTVLYWTPGGAVAPQNFPNFVKFLGKTAAGEIFCIVEENLAISERCLQRIGEIQNHMLQCVELLLFLADLLFSAVTVFCVVGLLLKLIGNCPRLLEGPAKCVYPVSDV